MHSQQHIESEVSRPIHIAIEGVIGVGKTTFATMLSEALESSRLELEQFENNPFLSKFYDDPGRYSFASQLFFLLNRSEQYNDLRQLDLFHQWLISDYTLDKDSIFARVLLSDDEYKLYSQIAEKVQKTASAPDLTVLLTCSVEQLQSNIAKRNRPYERSISDEYLHKLHTAYSQHFKNTFKGRLCVLDVTGMDFKSNKGEFKDIAATIFSQVPEYKPNANAMTLFSESQL